MAAPDEAIAPCAAPAPISQSRQIHYIVKNVALLDDASRREILNMVMNEVVSDNDPVKRAAIGATDEDGEAGAADAGEGQAFSEIAIQHPVTKEISFILDKIKNEKVIEHIYHIVKFRERTLNRPLDGR